MSVVITKFGNFQTPNINHLGRMQQGNPLGPLVNNSHAALFPHVQTSIGGGGVIRALPVSGKVYPATNHMF